MMKRIIALTLSLVCVLLCFAGCSHGENDKGAYIRMYLSEPVYDFDPLNAFDNQATLQIVSLLYEGLFTTDEDGEVENALVEEYEYVADEEKNVYKLVLTLKETKWSDGVQLTASDAQYAFLRLFSNAISNPVVGSLFDVKNARNIAAGDDSVDHLGVIVTDPLTLEIEFERDIDIDTFLPVLTSPAFYPLRADKIDSDPNWSMLGNDLVCSGPFVVNTMAYSEKDGFMLERNGYYYRDRTKDDVDKYVTPFRIIVDYKTPGAEQLANFNSKEAGALYYFGYIPLAARTEENAEILKKVKTSASNSTHVYYMNEAVAPFNNAAVRNALSLALDREAMAQAIVYAEAADALVPQSLLWRADKGATFRAKAESLLATSAKVDEAKQLLAEAGIKASDYSFTLTVNAQSEEHVKMAELAIAAWKQLGFKVTLNKLDVYEITTKDENDKTVYTGAYASAYREALQSGAFDVIALDLVSTTPTAFSYLAPFATAFSGNGYSTVVSEDGKISYMINPHVTGYNSDEYNAKIEAAAAETKEKKRAALLEEAEAILMKDMPVIPVVYNQNATLKSSKLSGIKATFYCPNILTSAKLSGYWKIALRDGFIVTEEEE